MISNRGGGGGGHLFLLWTCVLFRKKSNTPVSAFCNDGSQRKPLILYTLLMIFSIVCFIFLVQIPC